jgi:hypothetical protein
MESATKSLTRSLSKVSTTEVSNDLVNMNRILTIILVVLIVFSLAGVNVLQMLGGFLQRIVDIFRPLVTRIVSIIGFTMGILIEQIAALFTTTATAGVEIAGGTLDSVGDLLKDASRPSLQNVLSESGTTRINIPESDKSENSIQKPITSGKGKWCLVGEYNGRRGCVELGKDEPCLSGQVFPNHASCVQPQFNGNTSGHAFHPLKAQTTQ